jgi:hypothetical protein
MLVKDEAYDVAWAAAVALADWAEGAGLVPLPEDIRNEATAAVLRRLTPILAEPAASGTADLGVTLIWAAGTLATRETLGQVCEVIAQAFAGAAVQAGAAVRAGVALIRQRADTTNILYDTIRLRLGDGELKRYLGLLVTARGDFES